MGFTYFAAIEIAELHHDGSLPAKQESRLALKARRAFVSCWSAHGSNLRYGFRLLIS